MEPFHAVVLTVSLFVLTFFNPGANLFVVVQTSLASGRRAGVITGLGVATRDAFYSGLGLFGLATLITQCEAVFSLIKIVGGAYLLWFAWNSIRHQATPQMSTLQTPIAAPWTIFFRRGLMTDLSNPQTVLFFISIFSVTLSAETHMGKVNGLGRNCAVIRYLAYFSQPGLFAPRSPPRLWTNTAHCQPCYRRHYRDVCAQTSL